jgi:hypothetical protein
MTGPTVTGPTMTRTSEGTRLTPAQRVADLAGAVR